MGLETAILISVGAAVASASVGAYAAVQQGEFQAAAARQSAREMEVQAEVQQMQRSAERLDETSQELERARQLDRLFREQRVATASSGLMGNTFDAMQASDLAAYHREQALAGVYSSTRETSSAMQIESMRRQAAATRASGAFAQKMGALNAAGGILQTASSMGMSFAHYGQSAGWGQPSSKPSPSASSNSFVPTKRPSR
jgi:hypothetical protein